MVEGGSREFMSMLEEKLAILSTGRVSGEINLEWTTYKSD